MILKKIWYFFLATGPFFLFSVSGLIGKTIGFPWMNGFINNPNLADPVVFILGIYAVLNFENTVKNAKQDENSSINKVGHTKIWVPVFAVMHIALGIVFFLIDLRITLIDIIPPEYVKWIPSGWITLGYLVGFLSILPSLSLFAPTSLKNFLSSKHHKNS